MKVKSIVWCAKKTYSVYAHYDDIGKMEKEKPDQTRCTHNPMT